MKNFADRLSEAIEIKGNPTVMGLDPLIEYIPQEILAYWNEHVEDKSMASAMAILQSI